MKLLSILLLVLTLTSCTGNGDEKQTVPTEGVSVNVTTIEAGVDAATSAKLRIYKSDNTTLLGNILNIGQTNYHDGTNVSVCEVTYYTNTGGQVSTLTQGDCASPYNVAAVGSAEYFPNTTCTGNDIRSLGGQIYGTFRDAAGNYYGSSLGGNYGSMMYYTNMPWSQWNYGTNTCVPVSPYVAQWGYTAYGTLKVCGLGRCIIR